MIKYLILKIKNSLSGFTLLEVLLGITLLVLVSLSLYSLYNFGLNVIWESKTRVDAAALANERLERVRNLAYDSVGTQGGIPSGTIAQSETVTRNSVPFTIQTNVIYIDDPFDGTVGGSPADPLNTDYKRVRIGVNWPFRLSQKSVVYLTDVAPKGVETTASGGTLQILVFNSSGSAVPNANVHIVNSTVSPAIDLQTLTDAGGNVVLPGAPPATDSYEITVTKSGYSTDETLAVTQSNPSPAKPHVSVFESQLSSVSFSIDTLSTIQIVSNNYQSLLRLPFVTFKLTGAKTIGTDSNGKPIYKYESTHSTDTNGHLELVNMEWDSYTFSLDPSSPYDLAAIDPLNAVAVVAGTNQSVAMYVYPKTDHSFSVAVKNVIGSFLEGAFVQLSQTEFLATSTTPTFGQVFFPSLTSGQYDLSVTLTGFQPYTSQVAISGAVQQTVTMTE